MAGTKQVFITGVAGMIGSHLLDDLIATEKYSIVGVDNLSFGQMGNIKHNLNHPRFQFHRADILDFKKMKGLCQPGDRYYCSSGGGKKNRGSRFQLTYPDDQHPGN